MRRGIRPAAATAACANHGEAHLSPEIFDNGAGSAAPCPCDCCQAAREAAECAACACAGCSEGNCCDHQAIGEEPR